MPKAETRLSNNSFTLNEQDEKHISAALYLLQKAIVLREKREEYYPMLHAVLRDAAIHCEEARKYYTKDKIKEIIKAEEILKNMA